MPAFIIGTIRVTDAEAWQDYVQRVGATFERHGGRVLLRGAITRELAGQPHGDRVVVAEFADLDALMRWHESPEYQSLIALRDAGAEVVLTAYQTSAIAADMRSADVRRARRKVALHPPPTQG